MRIFAEVEIAFFGCFYELTNMVQQFCSGISYRWITYTTISSNIFWQVIPNKKIQGS